MSTGCCERRCLYEGDVEGSPQSGLWIPFIQHVIRGNSQLLSLCTKISEADSRNNSATKAAVVIVLISESRESSLPSTAFAFGLLPPRKSPRFGISNEIIPLLLQSADVYKCFYADDKATEGKREDSRGQG